MRLPFSRRPRPASDRPRLSVVIPVHDIGRYLHETLDSVLAQPVQDIEVVVVDDGSTDDTAQVAASYAARDGRVRVMTQPNSGVSIARNRAVPTCRGTYLTFADGDDLLPDDAWTEALATLERTGSDFVVGGAERQDGGRRFVTPLMRRNHERDRLATTVADMPLVLADVFVWNKVFRSDFYAAAGITFPERTRYQDQVAMTQAFLAASRFDVLARTVYIWRVRPDRTSATQRRADLSNLRERLTTKAMTVDLVQAHGDAGIERVLFEEVLPIDMWEHFRASVAGDGDYWRELVEGTRRFWNHRSLPFEETRVPAQQRLMGWLVARDRREDLGRWLAQLDEGGPVYDGSDRLVHPWAHEVDVRRTPAPG